MKTLYSLCSNILTYVKKMFSTLFAIRKEQLEQRAILEKILEAVTPLPAARIIMTFELEGQITEGEVKMTNSQKVTASIEIVDKLGKPAPVDGIPVWAGSDDTIVTVTPAADGMSAIVAAVGPTGTAKVTVTADADLGSGVTSIFGEGDVSVTPGQAVGIKMTFSDPVEQ